MKARACLLCLAAVMACCLPSNARADGDPGSDVLVYQPLFLSSDAGVSIRQQLELGSLLQAASRAGVPIRVAIIASREDLGAVTELWEKPQAYARFLGLELSMGYTGRLLVVMPNGFGVNWPGHSSAPAYRALSAVRFPPGGGGLAAAAQAGVRALAAAAGITLGSSTSPPSAAQPGLPRVPDTATTAPRSSGNDSATTLAVIGVALAGLAAAVIVALRARRAVRVSRARLDADVRRAARSRLLPLGLAAGAALVLIGALPVIAANLSGSRNDAQGEALARNPVLDPGTTLSGHAPDFTLTDQFGQPISLHSSRGKVVMLAFNDSECTTICPLTTTAMAKAKQMLGAAGSDVQLLGVDANPQATSIEDVLSYSQLHGLLHTWHFLTGSPAQLKRVWKAYSIGVDFTQRQIDHTPAVFVIDTRGRLAKLYVTQQSYAAVDQFGQLLAREASTLIPGHPRVNSDFSYAQIGALGPNRSVALPRVGGGTITLSPGRSARLLLFFATWDQEVTSLAGQLDSLNAYQAGAGVAGLPTLTAVDEASVEPSPAAAAGFLAALPEPLHYPVAIDLSGRLADGYQVQGEPWFVLTSPSGRILWYWQVSSSGWLSRSALAQHVQDALERAPEGPVSASTAQQLLAGSPPPLAALHQQAARLFGPQRALGTAVRALHGYPVVINAWASWCTPCRAEFGLLAAASAHYGRRIAFLGADSDDSAGDAQAFLAQHPVSYPSYQASTDGLRLIVRQGVFGLPTTIFINRAGNVAYVHTGEYDSLGTLDRDIATYARGS